MQTMWCVQVHKLLFFIILFLLPHTYIHTNTSTHAKHIYICSYMHKYIHLQPETTPSPAEMAAQLGQPLHRAGSGVWRPTLQRADSHPCQTPKKKRLRREPAPIYCSYLYSAFGNMSVTVCRLEGNMSLYVILYLLSLSKINLINVKNWKVACLYKDRYNRW